MFMPRTSLRAPLAAIALLFGAAALPAQVTQSARPAQVPVVHYQVLWRTELLAEPDTAARVLAWLDSGQVVTPALPETFRTGHARIVVGGRTGWVDNGYIKRVVTMRTTDTLLVPRRVQPPARKPGAPRADPVAPGRPRG